MTDLSYLMEEVCCGLETYFSSRTGGQYRKTAFILCDDYTELTSKLFLLAYDPQWSDKRANGSFKNYHDVMKDVASVVAAKKASDATEVKSIHTRLGQRRTRRNEFFHATSLLDLSVTARGCVEAFLDLLRYGEILFGADWTTTMTSTREMDLMHVLLKLDAQTSSDATLTSRINDILEAQPRNRSSQKSKGLHVAMHPDDMHLRMCLTWGGPQLVTQLSNLLAP